MSNKSIPLRAALAAVAATFALATPSHSQAEDLRGYTYSASINSVLAKRLEWMSKEYEKATNGESSVHFELAGSLPIKGSDITTAVGDGVIDIATDQFFLGNVPVAGVLRLPMLFKSNEEFAAAVETAAPDVTERLNDLGVTLLAQYLYPVQTIYGSGKITSLADLSGKKIRVTSPEQAEFLKKFNAVPVQLSSADVATGLQQGLIDGILTSNIGQGVVNEEFLKSNYRFDVNYANSLIIVNTDLFESMSAEDQETLKRVAQETAKHITEDMAKTEDELTEKFIKDGMTVTKSKPEDVEKASAAMAPYWEAWAKEKGADAQKLLETIRQSAAK